MKVLHLPTATGGNAWGLSRAERKLGLQSDVLVEHNSLFNYPADIYLELKEKPFFGKAYKFLKKVRAFIKIRKKYDVYHFNFGKSLLHSSFHPVFYQCDLPYYPKSSKLFVTYNGSDGRQRFPTLDRANLPYSATQDSITRRSIEKMSQHVEWIWTVNPDLLYNLPKEKSSFLPYTITNHDITPTIPKFKDKLIIVHAPTNKLLKGSRYILEAIDKLQIKYPKRIDFRLIEGLTHKKALEKYRQADIIIDQLLLGWYGAFSVEAMLMGKPVIVFIAEEDLKFIPKEMASDLLNTIINANPENIYHILEICLNSREMLRKKSQASLAYANKWHDPNYVASITKEKYDQSFK